jgi:hypothetical protein
MPLGKLKKFLFLCKQHQSLKLSKVFITFYQQGFSLFKAHNYDIYLTATDNGLLEVMKFEKLRGGD